VTLDAYSIAPPWHAHHLFDVLPKWNLSHLSGWRFLPFLCFCLPAFEPHVPSRGHATLTAAIAQCCLVLLTFESCIFLHVPLAVASRLSPWLRSTERLWPSHCLISARCCHATCAALLLSTSLFPHYRTYPCACRSTSRRALHGPSDASAPRTLWTCHGHGTHVWATSSPR
jgi:hypothetical protein